MKQLKQATKWLIAIALVFVIAGLARADNGEVTEPTEDIKRWHGLGAKPAGGVDLFTCRQMEDGTWRCGMNEGVSVGLALDIKGTENGALAFFDPQFKVSIHSGVKQADGTFSLKASSVLGFFPWGVARLLEGGVMVDLTEKPEGAKNKITILFGIGISWSKGGP